MEGAKQPVILAILVHQETLLLPTLTLGKMTVVGGSTKINAKEATMNASLTTGVLFVLGGITVMLIVGRD